MGMRTLIETAAENERSGLLIALLSGSLSEPEDFVRAGFPGAARARGIGAEFAMVEVRAAWFADGTIVSRIRDSVVAPARERGHSRIWFAGISLGALASLCYAARHESDVSGIVMISPYPATRDILREVDAAGGLDHWQPAIPPEGDLEREAWLWLARCRAAPLPVNCYFSSGDRFADGQRRMAAALDPAHVREQPGGHDWPSWRALWDQFLADSGAALQ